MLTRLLLGGLALALLLPITSAGADEDKTWDATVEKAVAYFRKTQAKDGSWSAKQSPGITGIVVAGLLKTGKVDRKDPMIDKAATKFDRISYLQVIDKGLRVMDSTAITLCMDNRLPIIIFNLMTPGNLRRTVMGEPIGSIVTA